MRYYCTLILSLGLEFSLRCKPDRLGVCQLSGWMDCDAALFPCINKDDFSDFRLVFTTLAS